MLGLPQSTEVKRPLPKAQLYKRFDWKPSQRECFDGDVSRLDFVNWIAPRTLPAIAEGTEVKEIYVVEVALKNRDFDIKTSHFWPRVYRSTSCIYCAMAMRRNSQYITHVCFLRLGNMPKACPYNLMG